jgi:uncharacterized protein (TIGR04442 family)
MAYSLNDRGFERFCWIHRKACDELSRETDDFSVFEEFSSIVTYFDRYDNVQALFSQISFMKNIEFTEDSLRSLVGNKKAFDELDSSLFKTVFSKDLLENKYITSYGKQKLKLFSIDNQNGEASYKDVIVELKTLQTKKGCISSMLH